MAVARSRTSQAQQDLATAMAAQAELASDLLRAMAHPQRLRVLCLLVEGERSVGDINREIDLSQSALSQHLARLREAGLVATTRSAQTIVYSLVPGPAAAVVETLHREMCPPQC